MQGNARKLDAEKVYDVLLDHGFLNVPLAKRGDIDAQLDKHKAAQAREAKDKARQAGELLKVQRAQAKQMVKDLSDERAQALMEKFKLTRKQLEQRMNSIAHWQPWVVLRGI